jgi:hypothetical protein
VTESDPTALPLPTFAGGTGAITLMPLSFGVFASPFVKIALDACARVRAAGVFGSSTGIEQGVDS